jgi:hypothetical protein
MLDLVTSPAETGSSCVAVSLDTAPAAGVKLSPSLFVDLPYSPVLLLDAHFGADLTDHKDFVTACGEGFEFYFENMYHYGSEDLPEVFEDYFYTWPEVEDVVIENVMLSSPGEQVYVRMFGPISLAWRAGFVLGWLSALALVDRVLALCGLALLQQKVQTLQRDERRADGEGWLVSR